MVKNATCIWRDLHSYRFYIKMGDKRFWLFLLGIVRWWQPRWGRPIQSEPWARWGIRRGRRRGRSSSSSPGRIGFRCTWTRWSRTWRWRWWWGVSHTRRDRWVECWWSFSFEVGWGRWWKRRCPEAPRRQHCWSGPAQQTYSAAIDGALPSR